MNENPELLEYLGHRFDPSDHDGQIWLRADELGHAMGLANPEQDVSYVYQNNWEQFSDRLTARLPAETPEGPRLMLAFNLLGAYVVSTFFLSQSARQFRRWLLETLVIHYLDMRREIRLLREQNEALERRVAALEAEMAQLKRDLLNGVYTLRDAQGQENWLEGEWRTMREQQARQGELLQGLATALEAAPPTTVGQSIAPAQVDAELDQLRRLRFQQLDQVDILREIVHEIRALQNPPSANECPPRPLSLEGPFPVWLGRIGGRDCPVVSARDLHAFLNTREDYGDWACWHTAIGHGLAEHIDYEHLRWLRPEGMHVGTGNYLLSLNAVVEIVRHADSEIADHVRSFVQECRQRMSVWMADSLVPPDAPWPDFMEDGFEAEPEGPMVLYFGETPLRIAKYEDGLPWVFASEICFVLGIANHRDAISKLDGDSKGVGFSDTLGGNQETTIISYSGLSTLTMRCHDALKPGTTAYEFRRWVTHDMLVQVYKTGRYEHPGHGRVAQPAAAPMPAALPAVQAKPAKPAKAKAGGSKRQGKARLPDGGGKP